MANSVPRASLAIYHISPTRTRGIIVKYILRKPNHITVKIELLIQNIVSIDLKFAF